jgi:crotonobetainyl-CoA:carnitine CoA-transferase CaiB-like acyl-CoA transferase
LAGVRVLDLTRARAGPTCVRQLSDFGADVIQVLDPGQPDIGGSDAANLQRNKRSIALDLHRAAALDVLLRLVDQADVFVENMRPGAKHRLGIGPDTLLARNPRLVYASISGFGQTGPYAERPCVDQIAQGMSGLMSVTGPPGSGPWRVGIAISDTAAGTFLTQGILAALFARARTGRGQFVETSLLASLVNFMDFQACRWLSDGEVPPQQGNDHPTFFPMGTYRTADGYINVAGIRSVATFVDVIGAPDLLDDARFATNDARVLHRNAFNAALEAHLARAPTGHWVEALNAAGIPAGPVYRMDEVFDDPQVRHLDLACPVEAPDGVMQVLRHPVRLGDTPTAIRSGPPRPGGDTRAVLGELGYDDDAVEALLDSGAAATAVEGSGWLA